ncbi:hypothetical protein LTR07_004818 [Exophiala xenobiotica]|nr:hypothetical protein LTR61_003927 [Exophiala xenobiotica]KAK5397665.1 hypothetical protein LTR79_005180 [Exophiala xenobiotica]KAK5415831.1 hypothetical protein LTR06_003883 [Exophiala xenobiotica]KAK5508459.1 hypothetical protein LTR21_008257 [Exophiala xenobiotica]KAK5521359.1 hypothetical protein LTR07_004818 [Exophiala xenobiotica]
MVSIKRLPSLLPDEPKTHHFGNPPKGFQNPWPSHNPTHGGPLSVLKCRFARDRPEFVPVPADRSGLVPVQKVDFSSSDPGFKVTWIGHASFLLQTSRPEGATRGINILCDPVFSERTSPFTWLGPKRYTPTPCTLQELLDSVEIDAVLISHNHYDHADEETLKAIYAKRKSNVHFLAGLHNARWLSGFGIDRSHITELDWWDGVEIEVGNAGTVRITCTPTQHFSSRWINDRDHDLWCSYAIHDLNDGGKKLYFAGDTAYRTIPAKNMSREEEDAQPVCPTFKQVGDLLGPFDLALLPIGLCEPREWMSTVHANSWDSIRIHRDVRSKKSIESIRSMYRWYRNAKICYAYLYDVDSTAGGTRKFQASTTLRHGEDQRSDSSDAIWFERGWTLQELLAPMAVRFYDSNWRVIGTKANLARDIAAAAGIEARYLGDDRAFRKASIATKMSWLANRTTSTKRCEDIAYSTFGIFGISDFAPLYGEGMNAFLRLQKALVPKQDESLPAWTMPTQENVYVLAGRSTNGAF